MISIKNNLKTRLAHHPFTPINKGFDRRQSKRVKKSVSNEDDLPYFCHPIKTEGVAQLVRASVCGTEGRGFETPRSPLRKTYPAFRAG